MPELINHHQAIEALRAEVAQEGPDHVYEKPDGDDCFYTWGGQPSCLVGRALFRLGVPLDELRDWENANARELSNSAMDDDNLTPIRPALTTVQAAQVFQVAQFRQDDGLPWGNALEAAEELYADYTTVQE